MSNNRCIDIYLDGLADLVAAVVVEEGGIEHEDTEALSLCLSRAHCEKMTSLDLLQQFADRYGIKWQNETPPLAALSYYYYHETRPRYVLFADPVHLKPDRDHLVLFAPQSLDLSLAEANLLTSEIERCYQEENWRLDCLSADNWALTLTDDPGATFKTLAQVTGKSVGASLPSGQNSKQWRVIGNEIQMLLNNHPVNRAREQAGRLTANSVWFWGGGSLPDEVKPASGASNERLWTNHSGFAGLGKLAGLSVSELPADVSLCLEDFPGQTQGFIYINRVDGGNTPNERLSKKQSLQALNTLWIAPLLDAMTKDKITQLRIFDDRGRSFRLDKKHLRRWWKRPRDLTTFF
ncbi:MAG: hypothetical protein ACC707_14855 [Thiohalomonadales bacterium]